MKLLIGLGADLANDNPYHPIYYSIKEDLEAFKIILEEGEVDIEMEGEYDEHSGTLFDIAVKLDKVDSAR